MWWIAVPLAVSLSLSMAAIGFNVMHDGGHGAYSDRPWLTKLCALGPRYALRQFLYVGPAAQRHAPG